MTEGIEDTGGALILNFHNRVPHSVSFRCHWTESHYADGTHEPHRWKGLLEKGDSIDGIFESNLRLSQLDATCHVRVVG